MRNCVVCKYVLCDSLPCPCSASLLCFSSVFYSHHTQKNRRTRKQQNRKCSKSQLLSQLFLWSHRVWVLVRCVACTTPSYQRFGCIAYRTNSSRCRDGCGRRGRR